MPAHSSKRKAVIPHARSRAVRSRKAAQASGLPRRSVSFPKDVGDPPRIPEAEPAGFDAGREWQKLKVEASETFKAADAHPVPFLLVTRRGLILHANQAAANLLGLKR